MANDDQPSGKPITRKVDKVAGVAVHDSDLALCNAIDLRNFGGAEIRVASGGIGSATVFASDAIGGTYTELRKDGADLSIIFSGAKWDRLDDFAFPAHFVKLKGDVAGTVDVMMKA